VLIKQGQRFYAVCCFNDFVAVKSQDLRKGVSRIWLRLLQGESQFLQYIAQPNCNPVVRRNENDESVKKVKSGAVTWNALTYNFLI
jgi:hypothetical protein